MDLTLDPIQEQLAKAVGFALTQLGDPREELAAMGVPALGLPAAWGGLELGLTADVMVHRELGRGLSPLPGYRETALCLELLTAAGVDEPAVHEALAGVADGPQRAATVNLHRPAGVRCDNDDLVWGTSEVLEDADWRLALVRARADGGAHRWLAVPLAGPGCTAEPAGVLGTAQIRLHLNGARGYPVRLGDAALARGVEATRVRHAALLLGLAARAVETAREYVNQRRQFDRPLVDFQTVSHRLATLVAEGDGWELLLHEAAWRYDRELPANGVQALAAAADHVLRAARLTLQLHGVRGMLASSTPALIYRLASIEALRFGPLDHLWTEAGRARLRT